VQEAFAVASLVLFAALVVAFLLILRRAARVVTGTRLEDAFRRDGAALADRAVGHLVEAGARIDRVRRRLDPPAALEEILPAAREALEGLRAEIAALEPPGHLEPLRVRLADEVERAGRAAEAVEHGGSILAAAPRGPREVEGHTSIKRGYLNLLHAREALGELAADLRSERVDARRWFSERGQRT
jgi:hypothetical protein